MILGRTRPICSADAGQESATSAAAISRANGTSGATEQGSADYDVSSKDESDGVRLRYVLEPSITG